jgi:UDP-N-acetylmuramoylalanine--D-glutamate ligase
MKLLVAGMGKSGFAAARLALQEGHRVAACDQRMAGDLAQDIAPLLAQGLVFYGGSESPGLLNEMEGLILSPGVPRASDLVRAALERAIPVWGEMEWGFRHSRGQVIAVTGSNGKSTTTTLLGRRRAAHFDAVRTGGNLGEPFCDLLEGGTDRTWYVLEASSFQLESIDRFRARVAILLNITPDHQDRYDRFEAYASAKGAVFANQSKGDFAVFSAADHLAQAWGERSGGRHVRFSALGALDEGAFVLEDKAVWRREGEDELLFELADLPLPGLHNRENALAASLAARCAGVPAEKLGPAMRTFAGLPHRLEKVGVVNGASVYNDSKATNTDAVLKALTAFQSNVILLLGGKDKGADWASLSAEIDRCCRLVLAFGAARNKVETALRGTVRLEVFETLQEATRRALAEARPGDSVVMSPACASFDEFRNFEDRGDQFRAWVGEASDS